jgi:translation initiation factor 1A
MATQAQTLQKNRGGKRAKKQANHSVVRDATLQIKEEGQEYAKVTKTLGNCRFTCECYDSKVRLGLMRGKNTKGKAKHDNMTGEGDYVLVGLRDFGEAGRDKDKCDIILKYSYKQVKELIKRGELPTSATLPKRIGEEDTPEENMPFDFEDI